MQEIYLPNRSIFKGISTSGKSTIWADSCVWIEVTPKKLSNQNTNKITTVLLEDITNDDTVRKYTFLAPKDMQETVNHTWDPLENVQSVLSQKLAGVGNVTNQNANVYKIDTPLLYKDTSRRSFSFIFNLVWSGKGTPFSEVVEPVRNLLRWSSPILPGGNIYGVTGLDNVQAVSKVTIPYVFTLRTKTGSGTPLEIFNIKAAALTSVQPTYSPPYINGYPSRAEVTLTFSDIEPINRSHTFRNINVSDRRK